MDGTDVLVGVKAELGTPSVDYPDQGRVEVTVEWYSLLFSFALLIVLAAPVQALNLKDVEAQASISN